MQFELYLNFNMVQALLTYVIVCGFILPRVLWSTFESALNRVLAGNGLNDAFSLFVIKLYNITQRLRSKHISNIYKNLTKFLNPHNKSYWTH